VPPSRAHLKANARVCRILALRSTLFATGRVSDSQPCVDEVTKVGSDGRRSFSLCTVVVLSSTRAPETPNFTGPSNCYLLSNSKFNAGESVTTWRERLDGLT